MWCIAEWEVQIREAWETEESPSRRQEKLYQGNEICPPMKSPRCSRIKGLAKGRNVLQNNTLNHFPSVCLASFSAEIFFFLIPILLVSRLSLFKNIRHLNDRSIQGCWKRGYSTSHLGKLSCAVSHLLCWNELETSCPHYNQIHPHAYLHHQVPDLPSSVLLSIELHAHSHPYTHVHTCTHTNTHTIWPCSRNIAAEALKCKWMFSSIRREFPFLSFLNADIIEHMQKSSG